MTLTDALTAVTTAVDTEAPNLDRALRIARATLDEIEPTYSADPDYVAAIAEIRQGWAGAAVARSSAAKAKTHLESMGATPGASSGSLVVGTTPLDGTTQSTAFVVEFEPDSGDTDSIVWEIDGVVYRDDDFESPWQARYSNAAFPIDTAFNGDGTTGSANSFTLARGSSYVFTARVTRIDQTTYTVSATVAIAEASAPEPPDPNDPRTVVNVGALASGSTFLASQNDTIYDFEGVNGDGVLVEITATSNTEVRNKIGSGTLRIGTRDSTARADVGFTNCEGTFFHVRLDGIGNDLTRPFFKGCVDVNPQPHIGGNDIMQIYTYLGANIIDPVIDGCRLWGKQRPAGSDDHNDAIQFETIQGGIIYNPTIRNCELHGASNVSIIVGGVQGTLSIIDNQFVGGWNPFHDIIVKYPHPQGATAVVLMQGNTWPRGRAFYDGWTLDPASDVESLNA